MPRPWRAGVESRSRSAIIASAARAAAPPLSLRDGVTRASACSMFSTVWMPLPTASRCALASRMISRADSLATMS